MKDNNWILDEVPEELRNRFHDEVAALPSPDSLSTNDEFNAAAVQAMITLCNVGKLAISVSPSSQDGFRKRTAPIVGLAVRALKFYEAFIRETSERRGDIAWVYIRPVMEAYVNCVYLMQHGASSSRSFIQSSLKPEKEMLTRITQNSNGRALMPIERRMRRSIQNHLRIAGMSKKNLASRTQWRVDGKNIRDLMKAIGLDSYYAFLYGTSSHFIHGSWIDLSMHHLTRVGLSYFPRFRDTEPDPRMPSMISSLVGELILRYLRRIRSSRTRMLRPIASKLVRFFRDYDAAIEVFIQNQEPV